MILTSSRFSIMSGNRFYPAKGAIEYRSIIGTQLSKLLMRRIRWIAAQCRIKWEEMS